MMEAIILAGGLGTRLRSVVADLPKCMAPIAGRPFVDFVIDYFLNQGIKKFVFALGYKSEVIINHININYPNINAQYSIEEVPLGTGGAIRKACKLITGESALVANGDTLYKMNISEAISFFNICEADCVLTLKPMQNFDRYGAVEINKDASIVAFKEKQYYDEGLINGGIYLLNSKKFLQENMPDQFSFEKDYLEYLYNKRRMYGMIQDAYFIDIGVPEDFEKAQIELTH